MKPTRSISRAWMLAAGVLVASCAGSHKETAPPLSSPGETRLTSASLAEEKSSGETQVCDLVCEQAMVVPRPADHPDYTARAEENANQVLRSMHDDLLACYKKRVAVYPKAHAYITIDIVIDETGKVWKTETTGGAMLWPQTMRCITNRIQQATFDPPHNGGTLRIHVPFSFRMRAPGDETF